jgi:hypothetical protein
LVADLFCFLFAGLVTVRGNHRSEAVFGHLPSRHHPDQARLLANAYILPADREMADLDRSRITDDDSASVQTPARGTLLVSNHVRPLSQTEAGRNLE